MDYTEYTSIKNRFNGTPNLCDLFKLIAIETWKRIEFAYLKPGVKIYETTITQNLIFTINAYNDQYNLNIEIFEADDEKTNGNDFELIIKFPKEGIEYYAPIQAKKVYKNEKYTSMDHGNQIATLINYAADRNAIPFYLLYNFSPDVTHNSVNYPSPFELTGCTLIKAEHLFNNYYNQRTIYKRDGTTTLGWQIPNFENLNPIPSFPWHQIVCPDSAQSLLELLFAKDIAVGIDLNNIDKSKNNYGFFPLDSFKENKGWTSIKSLSAPSNKIDKINDEIYYRVEHDIDNISKAKNNIDKLKQESERNYPEFLPKSRIIISKG
ncbi:MAG: hypothetical protein JNM51_09550 [Bacteroidia bacterium]|nr:hypothetical protein [Bacteroidia bacterium]